MTAISTSLNMFNASNLSHVAGHSNDTSKLCSVSPDEWVATQMPAIILSTLILVTQFVNFVFFWFWPNKEAYVLFHVSLAISSFLAGICMLSSVIFRFIPLTTVIVSLTRFVTMSGYWYFHCSSLVTLLFISIDRWLSVEFAVKYRNTVSHRIIILTVTVIWLISFNLLTPGVVLYWEYIIIMPCSHRKVFNPPGLGPAIWDLAKGPIFLPFLFFSQVRILTVAAQTKLRLIQNRRINVATLPQHLRRDQNLRIAALRIVWSSLLASMAMVTGTLVANVPPVVFSFLTMPGTVLASRIFFYVSVLQHCYSPVIYLAFFPDYRKILYQICTSGYSALCRVVRSFLGVPRDYHPDSVRARPSLSVVHEVGLPRPTPADAVESVRAPTCTSAL